jgi:hypothetical protein
MASIPANLVAAGVGVEDLGNLPSRVAALRRLIHKAQHHFVVSGFAVTNGLRRIWLNLFFVELSRERVTMILVPFGEKFGLLENVVGLPREAVAGTLIRVSDLPVRIKHLVFHGLPAKVHMRHEGIDPSVVSEGHTSR